VSVRARLLLVGIATTLAALGGAASGQPAERVIGGTTIQIQAAPWTVAIRQSVSGGALLCTGSILDALHVLTAAHCVYDLNGNLAAITSIGIRAGISNFNSPLPTDAEQDRGVSSYRVHPGYTLSTSISADDVAVLALSAPLDLTGPAVKAAPLPSGSSPFPAGQQASIAGYGRETASASDGTLNSTGVTIDAQGDCGGYSNVVEPWDNAIALCADSNTAAICSGDSGSALVTTDPTHTIVGVASAVPNCNAGSHGIYVYTGAPEILSFIQGNDHPVTAPRETETTYVNLYGDQPLHVGSTLTCESGSWAGDPATISYAFIDTRTNTVVGQGASGALTLDAKDAGDTIACQAIATNAGGTAVLETTSTSAIGSAPKLKIAHVAPVTGTRGKRVEVDVSMLPGSGLSGKFGVCVTPPARVAPPACSSKRVHDSVGASMEFYLSLKIAKTARVGTSKLTITAVAGPSHGQSTSLLHVKK
jgi:secreted trypsin-like serine protease